MEYHIKNLGLRPNYVVGDIMVHTIYVNKIKHEVTYEILGMRGKLPILSLATLRLACKLSVCIPGTLHMKSAESQRETA